MADRWYRAKLLLRCLLYASVRGKAVRAPKNPAVIAVVLTGKLGDIVCGTPVLRAVRKHFPRARLVAAGGAVGKPLLEHSSLYDDYISVDVPDAEARIKALRADAVLVCGPSFLPAAHFYLSGTSLVALPRVSGGYSPIARALPYRLLQKLCASYPYAMGEYAPRERLRSLEPLGIVEEDTAKKLGCSEAARIKAAELLPEGKFYVGISATAGNKIKEWPEERFAAVADHVQERHQATVVLIGGPQDNEAVERVLGHMRHRENVLSLQGQLNLDELKAVISRLQLFISVDTGPIYMAEAFTVPTIDIVGPMDEHEQPPRGQFHRTVVAPRARPEMHILHVRGIDEVEARRQTLNISVDAVVAEADALIGAILRS